MGSSGFWALPLSLCAVCWRTLVLNPEGVVELPLQPLTGHQPHAYLGSFLHDCW